MLNDATQLRIRNVCQSYTSSEEDIEKYIDSMSELVEDVAFETHRTDEQALDFVLGMPLWHGNTDSLKQYGIYIL